MKIRTETAAGSAYWASYFINGDDSGLDDAEIALADAWLESQGDCDITLDSDAEPYFSWGYGRETGADCAGGDLLDYTLIFQK